MPINVLFQLLRLMLFANFDESVLFCKYVQLCGIMLKERNILGDKSFVSFETHQKVFFRIFTIRELYFALSAIVGLE